MIRVGPIQDFREAIDELRVVEDLLQAIWLAAHAAEIINQEDKDALVRLADLARETLQEIKAELYKGLKKAA